LLSALTKVVVESALEGELDDHLSYGKHDPVGYHGGNSRNGKRAKTVLTWQVQCRWRCPATARAASSRS
jgi:putative transposase